MSGLGRAKDLGKVVAFCSVRCAGRRALTWVRERLEPLLIELAAQGLAAESCEHGIPLDQSCAACVAERWADVSEREANR